MKESRIEALLKKEVRRCGGRSYKFTSPANRGVSDRIVVWQEGIVHFVELKTQTGRRSALQVEFAREVQSLGQHYFVLRGDEGVRDYIRHNGHLGGGGDNKGQQNLLGEDGERHGSGL